jgi:hypothetical protein
MEVIDGGIAKETVGVGAGRLVHYRLALVRDITTHLGEESNGGIESGLRDCVHLWDSGRDSQTNALQQARSNAEKCLRISPLKMRCVE